MRKVLFFFLLALLVSGGALFPYAHWSLVLFHTWLGLGFLVVFLLYSVHHLQEHRKKLFFFRLRSLSGWIQLGSLLIVLVTGIFLMLYGSQAPSYLYGWHHWPIYAALLALGLHKLSSFLEASKKKRVQQTKTP